MLRLLFTLCLLNLASTDSDPNYRLDSPLNPVHYAIVITPFFDTNDDKAFTFNGEINIVFKTTETGVRKIRLHSEDLEFNETDVTVATESTVIGLNPKNAVEFIDKYNFVDIHLESSLQPNTRYTLIIVYKGQIRNDLKGFYRSSYMQNGERKWLGATQMEPTHARKVFPCFDEPQYKAIFSLSIDRPASYAECLANTKLVSTVTLSNGYKRDVFEPTPVMSTYLVAFLVSEFGSQQLANTTRGFGVFARPEAVNQTDYAFDFGQRVVEALSEYFGIDYYSTDDGIKLDHVALPDFSAGAMENWGLVKYRESLLLYVPEESTPYYKYRVAQIMAHETTHMWFGDLVTCHWWSDTWLNEGFANYFQDYITALIEPEVGSAEMLVTGSVYAAYIADEIANPAPITNEEVNSPPEISGHFGTISYQKAGSVIRMMHHFIGDEAFKIGLNSYLTNNSFDLGYPNKIYSALNEGIVKAGSAISRNYSIGEVMSNWVKQRGHPLLEVTANFSSGVVTLTQRRFYANSSLESNELYHIPITYTTGVKRNFEDTTPVFLMSSQSYTFEEPDLFNHTWLLVNIQETGFYRVNYDHDMWEHIAEALRSEEGKLIHNLNRAKIVNDAFALFEADILSFDLVNDIISFLKSESDYSVWYAALSGLNSLRRMYIGTEVLEDIHNYAALLMQNIIEELGFSEDENDSFVTIRNRMQILEFACKVGHRSCEDNAVALFRRFKDDGIRIPPSLRPVSYCYGLKFGDGDDFDFLWQQMLTSNVANEAIVIQNALGCSGQEEKLKFYLSSLLEKDSAIGLQDVTTPFTSILANSNVRLAMEFFVENYLNLKEMYPTIDSLVTNIASSLSNTEDIEKFQSWLRKCEECEADIISNGEEALAGSENIVLWANEHKTDVLKVVRNAAARLVPVLIPMMIMVSLFNLNFDMVL